MTTEVEGLLEPKREALGCLTKGVKRKRGKRRMKRCLPPRVSVALQTLFLSCRDVFKGPGTVPSPQDVQKLCQILDDMMPEDVGLHRDLDFFKCKSAVEGSPRVTCTTIYECKNFSLCIFFLPANAVIPLHNHPGMTVFSKLLLGTMHIKAYDWASPVDLDNSTSPNKLRLARMKANRIFAAPCNTSVLYPESGGNIHEFRAITPSAVLDVLGPPYSNDDGRDCTYYRDIPYSSLPNLHVREAEANGSDDSFGWLEEIERPEDSDMDRIKYLGPQVIETIC